MERASALICSPCYWPVTCPLWMGYFSLFHMEAVIGEVILDPQTQKGVRKWSQLFWAGVAHKSTLQFCSTKVPLPASWERYFQDLSHILLPGARVPSCCCTTVKLLLTPSAPGLLSDGAISPGCVPQPGIREIHLSSILVSLPKYLVQIFPCLTADPNCISLLLSRTIINPWGPRRHQQNQDKNTSI